MPLADDQVERILIAASTNDPLGQRHDDLDILDDFRISIAGAQEKTGAEENARSFRLKTSSFESAHAAAQVLGGVKGVAHIEAFGGVGDELSIDRLLSASASCASSQPAFVQLPDCFGKQACKCAHTKHPAEVQP